MMKLLDFESFINESNMMGGEIEPKILPTLNPNLVACIGSYEGDILPEKIYITATPDDIQISKLFKSPMKKVSIVFNSDRNIVKDKGITDRKGGIYTHVLNFPASPSSELDVFICKTPDECAGLAYQVLGTIALNLGISKDYSMITAIVKSLNMISRDNSARMVLADVTSFKNFIMGLRNTYDLSGVKSSLGDLATLDKTSLDPQALLDSVKRGLV